MRGFFPFDFAQDQNDKRMAKADSFAGLRDDRRELRRGVTDDAVGETPARYWEMR